MDQPNPKAPTTPPPLPPPSSQSPTTEEKPAAPALAAPDAAPPRPEKKRKRKSKSKANTKKIKRKKKRADGAASAPHVVEGFSVFKGAEAKEAVEELVEVVVREGEDEAVVRRQKEAAAQQPLHLQHPL
ncbi:hypothetical protein ZWY2020_058389 [Hordeum vulgare]|nr:hypothetical protein ZWY2020_058389 [Hordeum vulgare]